MSAEADAEAKSGDGGPKSRQSRRNRRRNARRRRSAARRQRYLGLQPLPADARARRSCVMIQIDGLSFHNLQRALRRKRMPFMSRLLREGTVNLAPWNSMLPTSTSAFQAGLFYGNRENIPGFFWLDKKTAQIVRMNGLTDTAREEAELKQRVQPYPGLLHEGSAYSALFSGGAKYTFMTFSSLLTPRLNLSTTRGRMFLFALSQVVLLLRLVYYSTIELFVAFYDAFVAIFKSKNKYMELKFIVPRILSVAWVREFATLGGILDIERGVGPIYMNFVSYDEHAHHRGPRSPFAFWTLKGLDAAIKRIYQAADYARQHGVREYDIYVWSDHGQTDCVPFQEVMNQDPERHFDLLFRTFHGRSDEQRQRAGALREAEKLPRGKLVRGPRRRHHANLRAVAARIETADSAVPGPLRGMFKAATRPARENALRDTRDEHVTPRDPEHRIRVVSTGPVAHLYIMDSPDPMPYEAMHEKYPHFVQALAAHQALGFVLARTARGGCVAGCGGEWFNLQEDAQMRAACPPLVLAALQQRRDELCRWANMQAAGDIVLFGLGAADGEASVSFSYEYGAHSGPSPEELTPFIFMPADAAAHWPSAKPQGQPATLTLDDLHKILRAAYQSPEHSEEN